LLTELLTYSGRGNMSVASLSRRGMCGDWMIRGRGLEVTGQLWTN